MAKFMDKLRHKAQEVKGEGKRATGRATNNPRTEREGVADKAAGQAKQAKDHLSDAAEKGKRTFRE
ncbi:CsbD family protein [Hoyosella sp. G463]|uniref:CsbD family protein n=1 Tax=Lolliginicoccus lacisalsi TaxID=2742202 RepID=A0A927PLV8_9ACTN|nr:CsbD family protein [Lolliginicoccus lacisalsi]MBD8507273.1 CsbD family protein [Lolliginicoccus lacisalsi]